MGILSAQSFTCGRFALAASDDIRTPAGRIIIVLPGENGEADRWLEGARAGILTLAVGKKTPAHPEDERVLTSMVAGARIGRERHSLITSI